MGNNINKSSFSEFEPAPLPSPFSFFPLLFFPLNECWLTKPHLIGQVGVYINIVNERQGMMRSRRRQHPSVIIDYQTSFSFPFARLNLSLLRGKKKKQNPTVQTLFFCLLPNLQTANEPKRWRKGGTNNNRHPGVPSLFFLLSPSHPIYTSIHPHAFRAILSHKVLKRR
jgi:hypothetical protein